MSVQRRAHLGMDPGKSGFITIMLDGEFTFYPMPTHKVETGEKLKNGSPQMKPVFHDEGVMLLALQIRRDFPNTHFTAIVEDVHGIVGSSTTAVFNFGFTVGMQRMLLFMLRAEIIAVSPQKWMNYMFRDIEKVMVPAPKNKSGVKHDTKGTGAALVARDWPSMDFRKDPSKKVSLRDAICSDKVDSFLMCIYGYRNYK